MGCVPKICDGARIPLLGRGLPPHHITGCSSGGRGTNRPSRNRISTYTRYILGARRPLNRIPMYASPMAWIV